MVAKKTIIVTGGHVTPALAVIEKFLEKERYDVLYVGRKTTLEGDKTPSMEFTICQKMRIPFYSITAARFQRSLGVWFFLSLVKFPIGLIQSVLLIRRKRPFAVVSFGGYVALPIALAAIVFKVPFLIHEQTSVMGLTNRILSRFARWVCISWENTEKIPLNVKPIYTGNMLRGDFLESKKTDLIDFGSKQLPLLYITGGSQGSVSINRIVAPIVPQLVQKYRVLHQCGSSNNEKDYKLLLSIKNSLPFLYKRNYQIEKHIDPRFIGSIYSSAFMVISRSGANTITELAFKGVPAILIPLPWAAGNEQMANAQILEKEGAVMVAEQKNLDGNSLMKKIDSLAFHHTAFKERAVHAKMLVPLNAADTIVSLLDHLMTY